jgi:hypothetical protein
MKCDRKIPTEFPPEATQQMKTAAPKNWRPISTYKQISYLVLGIGIEPRTSLKDTGF